MIHSIEIRLIEPSGFKKAVELILNAFKVMPYQVETKINRWIGMPKNHRNGDFTSPIWLICNNKSL